MGFRLSALPILPSTPTTVPSTTARPRHLSFCTRTLEMIHHSMIRSSLMLFAACSLAYSAEDCASFRRVLKSIRRRLPVSIFNTPNRKPIGPDTMLGKINQSVRFKLPGKEFDPTTVFIGDDVWIYSASQNKYFKGELTNMIFSHTGTVTEFIVTYWYRHTVDGKDKVFANEKTVTKKHLEDSQANRMCPDDLRMYTAPAD